MKRISLEAIRQQQNSKRRTAEFEKYFKSKKDDFSDVSQTHQLENAYMLRDKHPEWYTTKPKKASISLRIDVPTLEKFKAVGKGYQTLMNIVLTEWAERNLD